MAHAQQRKTSSMKILASRPVYFHLASIFFRSIGQNSSDSLSLSHPLSLTLSLPLPLMLITRLVHASFVRESAVNYSTATQQRAGLKWRSV